MFLEKNNWFEDNNIDLLVLVLVDLLVLMVMFVDLLVLVVVL